jgi:hypothetical protein
VQDVYFRSGSIRVSGNLRQRFEPDILTRCGCERNLYRSGDGGSGAPRLGSPITEGSAGNRAPPIHAVRTHIDLVFRNPAVGTAVLAREIGEPFNVVGGAQVDRDLVWQRSSARTPLRMPESSGIPVESIHGLIIPARSLLAVHREEAPPTLGDYRTAARLHCEGRRCG